MVTIVTIGLSILFLLAFLYPFVIYPAVLALLPRKPYPQPGQAQRSDSVALVFCAYNEQASLPTKIENIRLLKNRWPALEVKAYSDCSSDKTLELLLAADDVLSVIAGEQRLGKAAGMRRLVESTQAEIIICTDANVTLEADAIDHVLNYFRDPTIGTVAGTLHYTNEDEGQTARIGSLFWRLEEWIKRGESETGSTMGADGSIFAIRRKLYPVVPPDLLDDLIASISPLFSGYRVVSAPDVHAYERATTNATDEFKRKRRIACRAYNTHKFLAPQLRRLSVRDKFKYFSHKYLRWFSLLTLLLFAISFVAALSSAVGVPVALGASFGGLALLAGAYRLGMPFIGAAAELITSIVAVGIGIVDAMAGRNYQTWDPAKSRQ
jgi:cellulose synthase/poly-beta-1,6-N-acetylglucosamine synthase-like glycosyltransferase